MRARVEGFMTSSREASSEVSEVPCKGIDQLDEVHADELDLGTSMKSCLRGKGSASARNKSLRGRAAGTSRIWWNRISRKITP